jgi:hypothetical protein
MAISTLAGTLLIDRAAAAGFLAGMLPFLRGFTLFFWATATWWLPMLVILEFWRHVWKKFPLAYDPYYWGLVFPIGMYSACTSRSLSPHGSLSSWACYEDSRPFFAELHRTCQNSPQTRLHSVIKYRMRCNPIK